MSFDRFIKTQSRVVHLFQNTIKKNRLVHTYLFEGARGTSKLEAAYYLSAMILCQNENPPCLDCEACLKVINRNHPNIFYISPTNDMIKKEQITQLEHEFSLTPLGEKKRIFIIDGIDKCNVQSANSLLKFLEDAKSDCYGILITENIGNVLPTIVSRSQVISFKKVSQDVISQELIDDGIDREVSFVVSKLTNNVEEAKKLISEGVVLDLINATKEIGESLVKHNNPYLVFIDKVTSIIKGQKEYNSLFIDIFVIYLYDLLYYAMNKSDMIIFKKEMEKLSDEIGRDYLQYSKGIEVLLKYNERLKYNINIDLMYAQMFIELGGINE